MTSVKLVVRSWTIRNEVVHTISLYSVESSPTQETFNEERVNSDDSSAAGRYVESIKFVEVFHGVR